jgi:YhgE/Pip-like protein
MPKAAQQERQVAQVRASALLKARRLWAVPAIVASIVVALMTLLYFGALVDPAAHLHGLPVLLVNEDHGMVTARGRIDLGQQVVEGLTGAKAVTSRLALEDVSLDQAEEHLNRGADYAAVVIPSDFTTSVLALTATDDTGGKGTRPTIDLWTNDRAGTLGVSLADGVLQPALQDVSRRIGHDVVAMSSPSVRSNSGIEALLSDPVTVAEVTYRPLPSHSALGLSAFYISLLTTMCGFLGAAIVNSGVDSALGHAASEVGPYWKLLPFRQITRWQTLLAKWIIAIGVVPLLAGVVLLVAIGILNMDAPHFGLLWVFMSLAAVSIAMGTLALFASLGTLGQLLAMLIFVYLALASSGGTVPIQALPGVYQLASRIEPLRQILVGVRAILYLNAQADAGVTHGFVLAAIGLVFWILVGVTVTVWYDGRGLYRRPPQVTAPSVPSPKATTT